MALVFFAFLSGIVTILSPCILPVLPIVLSAGIAGRRARPFGVILGFIAGFSFFTLALSAIVDLLGIPADALRWFAVISIFGFGVVNLVPSLRDRFELAMSRAANFAKPSRGDHVGSPSPRASSLGDLASGIPVGLSLGLVWTPCVGPIMASVISLAVSKSVDGTSVLVAIAYSAGTAIPMLAVMLGGRSLIARLPFLAKRSRGIQRGFGLVMIFAALSIAMQWDRSFQKAILDAFPRYGSGLLSFENSRTVKNALAARSGVGLSRPSSPLSPSVSISSDGRFAGVVDGSLVSRSMGDYGGIPDFPPGSTWLNSAPIDAKSLAGKVVLVDFWTFSCVNCIRTLPYLRRLYDSYKDEGLVIVGVHSPEFTFERVASNVQKAARDLGVVWPIILDNDYSLWKAYGNRYWPAEYIVDAKGRVRYWHFGEGGYEESEKIVRSLLAEVSPLRASAAAMADPSSIWAEATEAKTPETYLGYARGRGFASAVEPVPDKLAEYRPARVPGGGEWNLSGSWTIRAEHSESQGSSPASIELGFDAKDVYLVIEAVEAGASMRVRLDGEIPADTRDLEKGSLVPDSGRLYHLVSLAASGGHVLHIDVKGKMRLFAFTFG